jgi:hypothetical protein
VGEAGKKLATPEEQIRRIDILSARLLTNIFSRVVRKGDILDVFIEEYAFRQGGLSSASLLREIGGVVKLKLWQELGLGCIPIVAASARKLLCGTVPSKKTTGIEVKDFVGQFLRKAGASFSSDDESDAFVIANAGLHRLGYPALAS